MACPCCQIQGNAIRRAKAALKRWDEGRHKWQRKGLV
jgi:hypothetical protein